MVTILSPDAAATLHERFCAVHDRLEKAARTSGRDSSGISLIAVSKIHPAEAVADLAAFWRGLPEANFGVPAFGENYVQEALEKQSAVARMLPDNRPEWHFIGHVQSRKAKEVAGRFSLIHTVDSIKLARNLHKSLTEGPAAEQPLSQTILIQVNVGREPQKAGILPEDAPALLAALQELPHLTVTGLMCIPPSGDTPEISRPHFVALRELRDKLEQESGLALPHLSMGMSHDFELAINEGATIVRVGTDIFGARPPRQA